MDLSLDPRLKWGLIKGMEGGWGVVLDRLCFPKKALFGGGAEAQVLTSRDTA